jgi:hypothetical protein
MRASRDGLFADGANREGTAKERRKTRFIILILGAHLLLEAITV